MTEQEVKDKLYMRSRVYGVNSYTKKPTPISGLEWTGFNISEMKEFTGIKEIYKDEPFTIPTLEGKHTAIVGDIIISGIVGELYPCKKDIFKASYNLLLKPK